MMLLRSIATNVLATWRERGGVSAVEFAVAAPVLVALLIPLVDLGIALYEQVEVNTAAQAGADYALLKAPAFNSTAISSAVTGATGFSAISSNPAPSQSCGCPSTTGITAATCGAVCGTGQSAGTYVTVNAQASYTPMISYAGLSGTITLSSQSTVRIK
jgi:Flp pilus assembly protein TadG